MLPFDLFEVSACHLASDICEQYQRDVDRLQFLLQESEDRNKDLKQSARIWERIAVSRDEETKQLRRRLQEIQHIQKPQVCRTN